MRKVSFWAGEHPEPGVITLKLPAYADCVTTDKTRHAEAIVFFTSKMKMIITAYLPFKESMQILLEVSVGHL